jgi:hypothetical protein
VVSGTATQGDVLSVSQGSWSNSPSSYGYQWQDCNSSGACCAAISGATASSYTLAAGDVGHTVRAAVTATNAGGSGTASSAVTAVVAAASTGGTGGTGGTGTGTDCSGTPGSKTVSQSALDGCGYPSMDNTGPPAGTQLTNSNGFTASTAGAVYNGLNVNGGITITANNVTIENSNVTDVNDNNAAIQIARGVTGTQIDYDSIHGTNAVQSGSLSFAVSNFGSTINSVVIDHTNFYNGDRILAGYGTVTNSYCLGGANFSNSGGLEHDECIYTDGTAPGIRAIHDTLLNPNSQTAAVFVDGPQFGGGSVTGTVDIENSILAGGDYCLYGGGTNPAHTGPITIENNRFSRIYDADCGVYGTDAYFTSGSNVTWTGNIWDDTGQTVSR